MQPTSDQREQVRQEILQDIFSYFQAQADYFNVDKFRLDHEKYLTVIDELEREQVIRRDNNKYFFRLAHYINSPFWPPDEKIINGVFPVLKMLYRKGMNKTYSSEVLSENTIPFSVMPRDSKRVLMILRQLDLVQGVAHPPDGSRNEYISFQIREDILYFDNIGAAIQKAQEQGHHCVAINKPQMSTGIERGIDDRSESSGTRQPSKLIFISCGQRGKEKELGQALSSRINKTPGFSAFFAQDAGEARGLNEHIFDNLARCVGAIVIMHRRGFVTDGKKNREKGFWRSSVFINQEVAILHYRNEIGKSQIPVLAFIENGVEREGVVGFSILNPKPLPRMSDMMKKVNKWLKTMTFPAPEQKDAEKQKPA